MSVVRLFRLSRVLTIEQDGQEPETVFLNGIFVTGLSQDSHEVFTSFRGEEHLFFPHFILRCL